MVTSSSGGSDGSLEGRRVVLGITGGISAYKAAELCRLLVKAGASVRVVMTEAATRFIGPLTLQTLSGAPVALNLFDLGADAEIDHIRLADEAEILIVAPATADAIARLAAGMANDLLTAVALATRAPLLLAPAMNVNMWENPLTQANLGRLIAAGTAGGVSTVGPDRGPLACGWIGAGRLMEPVEIVAAAARLLGDRNDLRGQRVVVTAGPTREPVDDVRFLGNRSSGKMGAALAAAAAARGAEVTLVAGPGTPAVAARRGFRRIDIETAAEMERALADLSGRADVIVMAAAVADFRPRARVPGKLSRRGGTAEATLDLTAVPDLLAGLAEGRRGDRPYLVGFAAEMVGGEALVTRALAKLHEKGCDAIVANDVSDSGIGFSADENAVTVLFADGGRMDVARASKLAVADRLWTLLAPRLPGARPAVSPASPQVPLA